MFKRLPDVIFVILPVSSPAMREPGLNAGLEDPAITARMDLLCAAGARRLPIFADD
jgi:hypothetical protein